MHEHNLPRQRKSTLISCLPCLCTPLHYAHFSAVHEDNYLNSKLYSGFPAFFKKTSSPRMIQLTA